MLNLDMGLQEHSGHLNQSWSRDGITQLWSPLSHCALVFPGPCELVHGPCTLSISPMQ